ncbi:MAG: hypothetical protein AAFZ65_09215 [Planctomycetota bacterium]
MARILSPGWPLQMTTWSRQSDGRWEASDGVPRAFAQAQVTDNPEQYVHRWLMTDGLVDPARVDANTRETVGHLQNFELYGEPAWRGEYIAAAPWKQRARQLWTQFKDERVNGEQRFPALCYVKSHAWGYARMPDFATEAPPFFPASGGHDPRQIDDGPLGVSVVSGASFMRPEHDGSLLVVGSGSTRSEIWVVPESYTQGVPPGPANAQRNLTLSPMENASLRSVDQPQDFIREAWNSLGGAGYVILVSATIYSELPEEL